MTIEEFLKLIQPNLTIIAALFGFLILFIKLFWNFLNYEDKLREENLTKVKDLNLSFRKKHIEKKFNSWYNELKLSGYKWGIDSLSNEILLSEYDPKEAKYKKSLIESEKIEEILSLNSLEERLKNAKKNIEKESSEYIYSNLGEDFFNSLDKLYHQKEKINGIYHTIKSFCKGVWWSCLLLAILSIIGIAIRLAQASLFLNNLWEFTCSLIFIIGLISFMLLFSKRNLLTSEWENQQLYGDEE